MQSALDEHQGTELDGRALFLDKMVGSRGGSGGRGGRQSIGGRQSFGVVETTENQVEVDSLYVKQYLSVHPSPIWSKH